MKPSRRSRRGTSRITIVDVARLSGVAQSTVSLHFRDPKRVAPETAARIREASDRLGYVPNPAAMGLAASRSRVVGVVVPALTSAFFAGSLEALQEDLAHEGYQALVGHTGYDDATEERLVRAALSWSPAAIVLTGLYRPPAVRALLQSIDAPVIEMWELGSEAIDTVVGFSHEAIGERMFAHLYARGARRFGFLGARLAVDRRAAKRARGFVAAAENRGCPVAVFEDPAHAAAPDIGGRLAGRAIDAGGRIDGLACSNDLIALGALFEAQRRRVAVPKELKIVGFGNMNFAGSTVPPLTTIAPPAREIGALVAKIVLDRLRGETERGQMHDLGFELLDRGTA
ncbi:MAG: LacI family DNA-binding transcriptional regulator [Magnetospirillum sp.]|nr:LacI family DNA-binding transcriptional regulator [Magnetospirillum sp.]